MNNWMTVSVKYTKQLDNGALKRVNEPYLVAAMTFTDAEARIHEELGAVVRGEFKVTAIKNENIHDVFAYDDADLWHRCTVKYDNIDADTERTKKVTQKFLVTANSVKEATERMRESLNGLMSDFKITKVEETKIVEVMPYSSE